MDPRISSKERLIQETTARRSTWRRVASVAAVGALLLPSSLVSGHSGDALGSFASPTLDGVISPGEYGSCIAFSTFVQNPTAPRGSIEGKNYVFNFCESNDEDTTYYGIEVNDATSPADPDTLALWFDNEHDDAVQSCAVGAEDLLTTFVGSGPLEAILDGSFCKDADGDLQITQGDLTEHAALEVGQTLDGYVVEFSHPLDSGDPLDYSLGYDLGTGDTVGWCLTYDDGNFSGNGLSFVGDLQYPPGCLIGPTDEPEGDIHIVDPAIALKEKLEGLVATCKPCPPDVQDVLRSKIEKAFDKYGDGKSKAALATLKTLKKRVRGFVRSEDVSRTDGQAFVDLIDQATAQIKAPSA